MNDAITPAALPPSGRPTVADSEWQGMTLDELRRRRAAAMVRLEVCKAKLAMRYESMSGEVQRNGVRGLLFDAAQTSKLKKVDYLLLAFKAGRLIYNLLKTRRR